MAFGSLARIARRRGLLVCGSVGCDPIPRHAEAEGSLSDYNEDGVWIGPGPQPMPRFRVGKITVSRLTSGPSVTIDGKTYTEDELLAIVREHEARKVPQTHRGG